MNLEIILSGAISGIIGIIGTYLILKKVSNDIIYDLKEEIFDLNELQNNEDFQKFVYSIGGLIGKGARKGIGMDRKLNPKDVVLNMAVDWWESRKKGSETKERSSDRREKDPLSIT